MSVQEAVPTALDRRTEPAPRRRVNVRDYGIVIALVALVVFLALDTDTFLTSGNQINVLDQCAVVGILALGQTACILCGVFDLTASATLALAAIAGVYVTRATSVPVGFALTVAAGAGLGLVTGLAVVISKVNSFIATLALSIVYRGVAVIVTGGAVLYPLTDQLSTFSVLTWPSIFNLTSATIVFLCVAVVLVVLFGFTTFGRRVYAVGGNAEAARLSGVRVESIRVAAYAISGICAALAGLILASRAGSVNASMATGVEFTAITAAVVGGTSILGGEGAMWRALVGAAILTLIGNGFDLLDWNTTYQQVVQGCLIIIAVTTDRLLRRRRA